MNIPDRSEYQRNRYQANLEVNRAKHRVYNRALRAANKDAANARQAAWAKANPEKRKATYRKHDLKRKYAITPEEYGDLLLAQNNCCAICKIDKHNGKNWHVDHDHKTGRVRGILCNHCNCMLGYSKDNQDTLAKAILYLSRNNAT
jgi:hypothetical protein